jgi:undecaprenyl-diphosphatase
LVHINNFDIIRSLEVIGWTTLIFGILLGIADRNLKVVKYFKSLNLKDALVIGIAQILAIIPGTSRSGIVITAGLYMGFSRFDASKYSLLLSIPVIIAATTLESINLFIEKGFFFNNEMIMGIILSFCIALITIRLFMKWINKASLKIFVAYRIMLGILILIYAYI